MATTSQTRETVTNNLLQRPQQGEKKPYNRRRFFGKSERKMREQYKKRRKNWGTNQGESRFLRLEEWAKTVEAIQGEKNQ